MEFANPADWGLALAVLLTVLTSLITGKGLATSNRLEEWKEHANRERQRAEQSEKDFEEALRAVTNQLERLADMLERNNEIRAEFLKERLDDVRSS